MNKAYYINCPECSAPIFVDDPEDNGFGHTCDSCGSQAVQSPTRLEDERAFEMMV